MKKNNKNYRIPPKGAIILFERSPQSKFKNQWFPPKGSAAFFRMESDADFKKAHPVGYVFLVLLGILAFMGPPILYAIFGLSKFPNANGWFIVGFVGAFCIGIGLFNFVAIIIKQYLGHIVSIVLFLIGGILAFLGIYFQI